MSRASDEVSAAEYAHVRTKRLAWLCSGPAIPRINLISSAQRPRQLNSLSDAHIRTRDGPGTAFPPLQRTEDHLRGVVRRLGVPMGLSIVQVDAFCNKPFGGNPAAVCVTSEAVDPVLMQNIATEMNLSETAFVHPADKSAPEQGFRLRWFTPAAEVELCGHATLATAHVLWTEGHLKKDIPAIFETLSGQLVATRDSTSDWICLDFPSQPAQAGMVSAAYREKIVSCLGLESLSTLLDVQHNGVDCMAIVSDSKALLDCTPRMDLLRSLTDTRGLIVTCAGSAYDVENNDGEDIDILSRFFAPRFGIEEDPVTGSAHCMLGPYWAAKLGKQCLNCIQASKRRGHLRVSVEGDRVKIMGQAVTTMRGEIVA